MAVSVMLSPEHMTESGAFMVASVAVLIIKTELGDSEPIIPGLLPTTRTLYRPKRGELTGIVPKMYPLVVQGIGKNPMLVGFEKPPN